MKKLTVGLIGLAFVLCAFSAQVAGAVDVYGVASVAQLSSCTTNDSCSDGKYCNGAEVCNAAKNCVAGTPPVCSGGTPYCSEANDTCVACLSNDNCTGDGQFCNGVEYCSAGSCVSPGDPCTAACVGIASPCDVVGQICDETNNRCVECLVDADCSDGVFCNGVETCDVGSGTCNQSPGNPCPDYCLENTASCVECLSNDNCTDDGNPCNGDEVCQSGTCGSTGNPCQDQICIPNNTISLPDPPAPLPYICVNCDNDTQCDDGVYCNGLETCNETAGQCVPGQQACQGQICDETNDRCVECLGDDNCTEPEPFCVANTCVACRNDADCDNGTFCDGAEKCTEGSCGPGTPPCAGQICDEENDRCVECRNDNDCGGETPYCDEGLTCVQCLEDFDCTDNQSCVEGVCRSSSCALNIRPAEVRINKMFRSVVRVFKITGDEGFDPRGELDFGILQVKKAVVNKKGVLKVLTFIPGGKLKKGPYEVRVGNCTGTIIFK